MIEVGEALGADAAMQALADAKAYLRVVGEQEDALIERLLRASAELCEAFTRQRLLVRPVRETLNASGAWTRLGARPVTVITSVERLQADGTAQALGAGIFAIDNDAAGEGWVRVPGATGGRLRVCYQAGLAADWAGLPEALRQGIVRLAAHLYAHREAEQGSGPPAAVTALWRPWRRIGLR